MKERLYWIDKKESTVFMMWKTLASTLNIILNNEPTHAWVIFQKWANKRPVGAKEWNIL